MIKFFSRHGYRNALAGHLLCEINGYAEAGDRRLFQIFFQFCVCVNLFQFQ